MPVDALPQVLPSSGSFGVTGSGAACGAGIPIAGVAGDQHAALFGQAAFAPGDAKNTYGTGSFVLMNAGSEVPPPAEGLLTTVAWLLDTPQGPAPTYALEGSIFATGAAVQWLRDGLQMIDEASQLEALAAQCPSTGGVFLVPAFAGLGSPHWDPYARGLIVGLTRGTGRPEIARAAVEAMAFQTRRRGGGHGGRHRHAGAQPARRRRRLRDGFHAAAAGRPARREGATAQAPGGDRPWRAYLAGLAAGVWPSLEAVAEHWELDFEAVPRAERLSSDAAYADWMRAVERSKEWVVP